MGTEGYFHRGEAAHSPPSSAEVKNGGAIPPLPHIPSWHSAWQEVKLKKNTAEILHILLHIQITLITLPNENEASLTTKASFEWLHLGP
jgi:hypothetical protein